MAADAKRAVSAVDLAKALTALGISAEKWTNKDEPHNRDYLIEEILQEFGMGVKKRGYEDCRRNKLRYWKA